LRGEVLRAVVGRLQGGTRDLEWAHVQGALDAIERGRGGATVWLSPSVRVRLERGRVVVEQSTGDADDSAVPRPAPSRAGEDPT
jgi:hypothetical protein